MIIIAWDIETCPLPVETLGPRQLRRYESLLKAELDRAAAGAEEEDASRRVRSLHPALGWICCASFVRLQDDGTTAEPRSFSAADPDAERAMLRCLWDTLGRMPARVQWVTCNGKRFDCEWLMTRTVAHGLTPSRCDILARNPYAHRPHADLLNLWRSNRMGLADVCELLGVPTPKSDLDGSKVTETVASGGPGSRRPILRGRRRGHRALFPPPQAYLRRHVPRAPRV